MFNNFFRSLARLLAASDPSTQRALAANLGGGRRRHRTRASSGVFGNSLMKGHRKLMNDGYQGRKHASSRPRDQWSLS